MAGGRPSKYTAALAGKICDQIASGKSLVEVCRSNGMPNRDTVYAWVRDNTEFSDMYARARDAQADHYVDEIMSIADSAEDPQKARVQIDARKWVASKLRPRIYGDKQEIEHSGAMKIELVERVIVDPADQDSESL